MDKRFCFIILLFCTLVTLWSSCKPAWAEPSPLLRVAILQDEERVRLTLTSEYKICALHTNDLLTVGKGLWRKFVYPTVSGVKLDDVEYKVYGIRIQTKKDSMIYVNGRRYRGIIDIIRTEKMRLLVVNHIETEGYLGGVLCYEISHRWPMEAIKAQAIAARTFSLYSLEANKDKDFDVTADVYSQMYGGKISERRRTNKAVQKTKGKVLVYKGGLFPACYHATCAGSTEDAGLVWGQTLPPLKGVECKFCKDSPHFRWKKVIYYSHLEKKLRAEERDVGDISTMVAFRTSPSGRVMEVLIHGEDREIKMSGEKFRHLIGPNTIRSTKFTMEVRPGLSSVKIVGEGWGHGVGMCQWGAYFMAKKGYSAEEILRHYYPGADIISK